MKDVLYIACFVAGVLTYHLITGNRFGEMNLGVVAGFFVGYGIARLAWWSPPDPDPKATRIDVEPGTYLPYHRKGHP